MTAFFILTVTLAAVVAIVIFLRRQQSRATAEYAERHQPLPPLEPPELEAAEPQAGAAAESAQQPVDDTSGQAAEQKQEEAVQHRAPQTATPAPPRNWLQQCQALRNEGRLAEALALSEQALPQLQALEQQALTLRARLRDARQADDEQATQHWLDALYQVAARASLLHDAPPADQPESPRRLAGVMDSHQLETMEMPYREIGHEKLKLLRKTDRQLLELLYGQPLRHISAREWHHL